MKNPEFMSLLKDYMEELKENRDVYEQEITALEAERGNDITWIRPSPAEFVVKTHRLPQEQQQESEPNKEPSKVFINMCHSMEIDQPSMKLVDNRQLWSVPFSLSKPREDFDKGTFVFRLFSSFN
jgi:dynein assembly factor 2